MKRFLVFATAVLFAAAAAYAAKPAMVRLIGAGLTAQFVLDKGARMTVTEKGTPLAAGTYTIKAISVFKKDDKGKTWEMRYEVPTGNDEGTTLIVDEEQNKVVDVGPPLSIQGWARRKDAPDQDTIRAGFGVHGRFGKLLMQPMVFLNGRPGPVPTIKIVTLDGKVISQGSFIVSKGGSMTYDWKPGAFKGLYHMEITAQFGPFEWKQANAETANDAK